MHRFIFRYSGALIIYLLLFSYGRDAVAQKLNNPNKKGPLGTQVNTMTGNVFITRTDIYIPARAFDLNISFYYNSFMFPEDFGYGNGWTFYYTIQYGPDTTKAGSKQIMWGDGRADRYDSLPGGQYVSPKGFFNSLSEYQPGKYMLRETDGLQYFFDDPSHRKITRMQEPNGNFINFTYTNGLLTGMSNAAGQSLQFAYDTKNRLATLTDAITTPTRTFQYTYDAAGNLKQVTDPLAGKYQYAYLVNGPMKELTDKNQNSVNIIYYPDLTARELIGCNKRLSFSYDPASQTTIVTDHLETDNQVTKYTYKVEENHSWVTSISGNCCGFNMTYEYDENGNKIRMKDANGQVYSYSYDDYGNIVSATDPLGQVNTYTYTSDFKKLSSFRDPKGNLYTLSYDVKGNLTQLVTPGNNIYTATYGSNGDVLSSTDPRGNVYTYNYNAWGQPATVTGPNGYSATLSYDARGRLLSYTDARGNQRTAEYDILNRLKKITDPINNSMQFEYDAAGNLTSFKNQDNEVSILSYDASNRLVKITGPTGNHAAFTYDGMDNLRSFRNALGYEIKLAYDKLNRMKTATDADGNNMTYEYDGNGNVKSAIYPTGRVINYTYDNVNRLTEVVDGNGPIAKFTYDKNGNIISYMNGTGAITTATYDSLDRIRSIMDPLGNSMTYNYDRKSNITSVTDREGHTSYFTYDSLNRPGTFTDNNGSIVTVGYDAAGNITSLTDANNNTTFYTYDQLNRRKRMTFPGGKYREYTYDKKSNITAMRLTDGSMIAYQYDTLNRVKNYTLPGGEVCSFTYDKLNRVLTAGNNAGTITFTYDKLNRITSETFDGRTVQYEYSLAGRTQTIIYPGGSRVTKVYDARNRLTQVMKDSVLLAAYVYNQANQMIQKTFGNGASNLMQYDFANRLSSYTTTTANGVVLNKQFSYDRQYNKTAITSTVNPALSEQFTYDNDYRLTNYKQGPTGSPVFQNTYSYDAVGNRVTANLNGTATNYSVNNLNQVTGVNGTNHLYDDRGNLAFDGVFYKTYDGLSRLVKDSSSPSSVITYGYDALGRRVSKTVNGNLLKYTYMGVAPVEERDAGNNMLNQTVFTHFLAPLMNERNDKQYYYHANDQGSVEAISNEAGRITETYQYDAFGKLARYDSLNNPLAASIAGNRFGFTGQEYDSATGSYRFFYRNYSPVTGVFNQRDLLEYEDGMSMYQYVDNNPANGIDVWGLKKCSGKTQDPDRISNNTVSKVFTYIEIGVSSLSMTTETLGLTKTSAFLGIKGTPLGWINTTIEGANFINGYSERTNLDNFGKGVSLTNTTAGAAAGTVSAYQAWNAAMAVEGAVAAEAGGAVAAGAAAGGGMTMTSAIVLTPAGGIVVVTGVVAGGAAAGDLYISQTEKTRSDQMQFEIEYGAQEYQRSFGKERELRWLETQRMMERNQRMWQEDCEEGGTQQRYKWMWDEEKQMWVLVPFDPNLIIGPEGKTEKKWVSVKEILPYTILFENDSTATARARYVKVVTPVEPHQDPTTLELTSVGFNNQSFDIPLGQSSYYQRLDARDSTGVYVDLTAGYDVVKNEIFWELRAIDPITLLPPDDPMAGFLLLKDATQPAYGNGFVSFSIKPRENAQTLDTIGARAFIVFDENEVIPTNIHTNTIDALPPTSHLNTVTVNGNSVKLAWTGADDTNGSGIDYYTVYVSTDNNNYSVLLPRVKGLDTTVILAPGINYCFFVLATDLVGHTQPFDPGSLQCASVGPGPLPVTWLFFTGDNVGKDNLLNWATASEQNSKEFRLERSLNGTNFTQIAVVAAAGNSIDRHDYNYTDRNIDLLNSDVMFYRLKQVDLDGNFTYSPVVRLNYRKNGTVPTIVYPNPTQSFVTVVLGDKAIIGTEAYLVDVNGRVLQRFKFTSASQTINLNSYVNGIYFIRMSNNEVLRVVKQ